MAADRYPKQVYIIFPFNEEKKVAGAYVGASNNVEKRMRQHECDCKPKGNQTMLHELMRKNDYTYAVVDVIRGWQESHIEYDWMDYCQKKMKLQLFNNQIGLCNADWRRLWNSRQDAGAYSGKNADGR